MPLKIRPKYRYSFPSWLVAPAIGLLPLILVGCSFGDSFTKSLLKQDQFVLSCQAENGGDVAKGACVEWKDSCQSDQFRSEFAATFVGQPISQFQVGDPDIVQDVLEDGKLSQDECLSKLSLNHIFYKDMFSLALAANSNSSNAVVQTQLGKIYTIKPKGVGNVCLTADPGQVSWKSCSGDGIDMKQQFHFISRQHLKYQRLKGKVDIEDEAFRLLPVSQAQVYYELDKSSLDDTFDVFKGLECIHLNDSNELTYSSCNNSSYFMLPPSRFGFNKALTDEQTRGEVGSQDGNRFVSLLAFQGKPMTAFLDSNRQAFYAQQFKFSFFESDDFFEGYDERILACEELKSALDEEQTNLGCLSGEKTDFCRFLSEQKATIESSEKSYNYCDTCAKIQARINDIYLSDAAIEKAKSEFEKNCKVAANVSESLHLDKYSGTANLYHIGYSDKNSPPSVDRVSSYFSISDSQDLVTNNQYGTKGYRLSVEECEFSPVLSYGLCSNSAAIKKLLDYELSSEGDQVYQLRNQDQKCLRFENEGTLKWSNCDDRDKNGDTIDQSTHVVREPVTFSAATDPTRVFLQFRSKKYSDMCVSGNGAQFVPVSCAEIDGTGNAVTNNSSAVFEINPDGLFLGASKEKKLIPFPCSVVSDDQANKAYDCNYEAPKWISIIKTLSFALLGLLVLALPFAAGGSLVLGLAMIVFSIPSYVMEGVLCAQNSSKSAKIGGCMGIAMGVPIDLITFGVFDAGRFASAVLYKTGKVAGKTPGLKQIGRSWHISRTINLLQNSKSFGSEFVGDVSADQAGKMKFIRFIASKKLTGEQLDQILKSISLSDEGSKLCGKLKCTHPALKSSEWTSAEGRGKFISSLREEVDRYIGEASAKAADDKLTKWERVWNVVMWNSPSKNQTTVDIMKAVQTLLNPNSTDQALQNAYVTLRNRNHSHIQSGL